MRPVAWISRSVLSVFAAAVLIAATIVGVMPRVWRMANAHDQVPVELPDFAPLSQRSIAYDVSGKTVIAIFERENSQPVKLSQVPEDVIAAFLAVEDAEFYHHNGFNLRGFVRAVLSNVSSEAPVQGASTITQQVAKNEYLAGLPRDGRYKLIQAKYAMSLENKLTKSAILERYLSTVFFGNNAYGLAAAAETYFNKDVSKLTLVEGAFLAGLVRSPSGYDPIRRLERSRARFRQVMDRLIAENLVTETQGKNLAETWALPEVTYAPASLTGVKPTYFSEAMKQYLLERSNILGDTEQERANQLFRGGLRIQTTLNPALQAAAEEARNVLPATRQGFDAAILSLDVKTGAIRAMVGGAGFVRGENEVNMTLKPRQTGSSIKLFILAAALQAGATPRDIIDGAKPCTLPSEEGKPFVIEEGATGFVGPLEQQTWKSINCAFSRLAQIVGLNRVVDTTYRMADSAYLNRSLAKSVRTPIMPYASFATGANEMAAIDMAAGMQTLANQGLHHQPYYVEVIKRVDGSTLYQHSDPGVQVLDPGVALTTIDILKGVLTKGTARSIASFARNRPAAGKTGTQENNTNSWFVGATPQLATAVWVGDPDKYTKMVGVPEFVRAGVPKVQGGTFPAKIWAAYYTAGLGDAPAPDWPAPPAPTRSPRRLYLPGNECLARPVGGGAGAGADKNSTSSSKPKRNGFVAEVKPKTTPTTEPPTGSTTKPRRPRSTTTVPRTRYKQVNGGTTIPPDVLDPAAPLPSVGLDLLVYTCGRAP